MIAESIVIVEVQNPEGCGSWKGRSTGTRKKAESVIVIQNSMTAQSSGSFFHIKHAFNS